MEDTLSYNNTKVLNLDITIDYIFGTSDIFTKNGISIIKLFLDNNHKYIDSITGIATKLGIANNTVKYYVNSLKFLGFLNEVHVQNNMRTFMLNKNSDIVCLFYKIRDIKTGE